MNPRTGRGCVAAVGRTATTIVTIYVRVIITIFLLFAGFLLLLVLVKKPRVAASTMAMYAWLCFIAAHYWGEMIYPHKTQP